MLLIGAAENIADTKLNDYAVDTVNDINFDEFMDEKLTELKEELFNLRFQLAVNQLENSSRIGAVKKDIARISTVLRQMELNGAEA